MTRRFLFYISQNYSYAILRPMQEAIERRGDQVRWFLEGSQLNPAYLRSNETRLHSVAEVYSYNPEVVLVPGNMVPAFFPGLKVGLFHGFDAGKVNRRGIVDHFNVRCCFDLYCTQGPNTTNRWQQLAEKHQYFLVRETGWPALDPLFNAVPQEASSRTPSMQIKKRPTILFCSTFSRRLSCANLMFDEIRKLSQSNRWQWLVQFHPKMDAAIVNRYKTLENDNLSFIETDDIIPLLRKADVMVCDTSSVLLMFLLQNKPVVTVNNFQPRDCFLDIKRPQQLSEAVERALSRPEELMGSIQRFVQATHPRQDGESSGRVLAAIDDILDNNIRAAQPKPLNLLRNLKMRIALNYWRL